MKLSNQRASTPQLDDLPNLPPQKPPPQRRWTAKELRAAEKAAKEYVASQDVLANLRKAINRWFRRAPIPVFAVGGDGCLFLQIGSRCIECDCAGVVVEVHDDPPTRNRPAQPGSKHKRNAR